VESNEKEGYFNGYFEYDQFKFRNEIEKKNRKILEKGI
jgi:hypothetical protein